MHRTCLHACLPLRHCRGIVQKGGERRQAVESRQSSYPVSSTSTCSLSMAGPGHQFPQDALAGGGVPGEGDTLLVGVEVSKKTAAFPVRSVVQEGAVLPCRVTG